MGKIFKSVGTVILSLAGIGAVIWVAMLLLYGATYVAEHVLVYVAWAVDAAIVICVVFLLPLSIFHRTRKAEIYGFYAFSFLFGLCTFMMGLLTTMEIWGVVGVLIGMCFFGVGVVPVGMLASALHGEWTELFLLVCGVVLTFGVRGFALWLASRFDREEHRRQMAAQYGEKRATT